MSTERWTKKQLEIAAEQRNRCQKLYSDWKDNEFNCADNKFIWGVSYQPEETPSFCTLNYIQVYYNRKFKIYYLDLDPEIDCNTLRVAIKRFEAYLSLEGLNANKKLSLEEIGLDLFSAKSLEDLLFKFKVFATGYILTTEEVEC